MKQKIVIEVQYGNNYVKGKRNALKIGAKAPGVSSVSLEGEDRDQVVVVGQNVDAACLTKALRKKLGYAQIISVEEVKGKKDGAGNNNKTSLPLPLPPCSHPHFPPCVIYEHDPYATNCIIL